MRCHHFLPCFRGRPPFFPHLLRVFLLYAAALALPPRLASSRRICRLSFAVIFMGRTIILAGRFCKGYYCAQMRTSVKKDDPYIRFRRCCYEDPRTRELLPWLEDEGCDPRLIFVCLRAYIEKRDRPQLDRDRKKREKAHRSIIRRGVREYGVPPAVGVWLHGRADEAFDTKRMGLARQTESLAWLESYIEAKCGKPISAEDLASLIGAALEALAGRPFVADPETVRRELSRFKRRNPLWMKLLKAEFQKPPITR
jgi:hypothetical protein